MNRQQALAKIKKCLAIGKSANPHEAAAGLRQAQKLMEEFNFSEQDVSMADVAEQSVAACSTATNLWETYLVNLIASTFGCRAYSRSQWVLLPSLTRKKRRDHVFVGVGPAAQISAYAFEVLARQCARARLAHIRKQPSNCKPITKTARGDEFALGWVHGVADLVERFAGARNDEVLLLAYMEAKHPDLQKVTPRNTAVGRNVGKADFSLGVLSGSRAKLDRSISGRPGQELLS